MNKIHIFYPGEAIPFPIDDGREGFDFLKEVKVTPSMKVYSIKKPVRHEEEGEKKNK